MDDTAGACQPEERAASRGRGSCVSVVCLSVVDAVVVVEAFLARFLGVGAAAAAARTFAVAAGTTASSSDDDEAAMRRERVVLVME